jgi:hypothetical protein
MLKNSAAVIFFNDVNAGRTYSEPAGTFSFKHDYTRAGGDFLAETT